MNLSPSRAEAFDYVRGFLHPDEPAFLAFLAQRVPVGQAIVEIGSYRGRSTIAMAVNAHDGVLVYAIDPHEEHEAGGYPFGMMDNQVFMQNVSEMEVGHKIRVLNIPSGVAITAWQQMQTPIGLLFIDGGHEFEDVDSDVRLWSQYIVNGGILALHDSTGTWEAPTQVADELAASDGWTEGDGCAYTRIFRKDTP